jgi:hypothetical protein
MKRKYGFILAVLAVAGTLSFAPCTRAQINTPAETRSGATLKDETNDTVVTAKVQAALARDKGTSGASTPDPGRGGWRLPAPEIERTFASAAYTMFSDERPCPNYNRDAGQNYSGGDCGRGPLPGATSCPGGTPPQPRGGGGYGPGP